MTMTQATPAGLIADYATITAEDLERWPTLTGRQEPQTATFTVGDRERADDAVTLMHRIRQDPFPWQRLFLATCLMTNPDGSWANPDVVVIVPRQNGKSELLLQRIVYGLFVLGEKILFTAQRWQTAESIYERLRLLVRRVPAWRKRIDKDLLSNGRGLLKLKGGASAAFTTRSADTGRGMDEIDLVIFDEGYNLRAAHVNSILPVQLASRNPQTIYTSSAVNAREHTEGDTLAGLRAQGHVGEDGLAFLEYMSPDADGERDVEEVWRQANPSFGVIQTPAKMRKALRAATTPDSIHGFDTEYLGRGDWPNEREDVKPDYVIDPDVFAALARKSARFGKTRVLAIDMAPHANTVDIACAARTLDGADHVEIGYHGTAKHEGVLRVILALIDRMAPAALVMDAKSPVYNKYYNSLVDLGIRPLVTNAEDMGVACGGFEGAVLDGTLSHTGDPLLVDALEDAEKRDMVTGAWAWNRRNKATISPLVAVTLARWGLDRIVAEQRTAKIRRAQASATMTSSETQPTSVEVEEYLGDSDFGLDIGLGAGGDLGGY